MTTWTNARAISVASGASGEEFDADDEALFYTAPADKIAFVDLGFSNITGAALTYDLWIMDSDDVGDLADSDYRRAGRTLGAYAAEDYGHLSLPAGHSIVVKASAAGLAVYADIATEAAG